MRTESNQSIQSHSSTQGIEKSTVSHWKLLYHFPTSPRLLQEQGNDDNRIEELKKISDSKEDSNKTTFHRLRALSWDEPQGCGNNKKGTNSKKKTWWDKNFPMHIERRISVRFVMGKYWLETHWLWFEALFLFSTCPTTSVMSKLTTPKRKSEIPMPISTNNFGIFLQS